MDSIAGLVFPFSQLKTVRQLKPSLRAASCSAELSSKRRFRICSPRLRGSKSVSFRFRPLSVTGRHGKKAKRVHGDVRLSKTRIAREIALLIGYRLTCGRHAKPLYVIDIFNRACRASFAVRLALQKADVRELSPDRPLADLLRTKSKRPGTQSESAWRKQNAVTPKIAVNRGAWSTVVLPRRIRAAQDTKQIQ